MKKYTMKDWQADGSLKAMKFQEVDEEIYNDMYCCMPPINYCGSYFQVGEPYGHVIDEDGKVRRTYSTFCKIFGRCFFLGHLIADVETIERDMDELESMINTNDI